MCVGAAGAGRGGAAGGGQGRAGQQEGQLPGGRAGRDSGGGAQLRGDLQLQLYWGLLPRPRPAPTVSQH